VTNNTVKKDKKESWKKKWKKWRKNTLGEGEHHF